MPKKRLGAWEYGLVSASVFGPAVFVLLYQRYVSALRYPVLAFFVGVVVVMAVCLPIQSLRQKRADSSRSKVACDPYRIAIVVPFSGWPFRVQLGNKQTLDGRSTVVRVFKTVTEWLASETSWDAAVVYESFVHELHERHPNARVVVLRGLLSTFPQYSVVEFPTAARTPGGVAACLPIDPYVQPKWARGRYAETLFMLTITLAAIGAALLLWLQPN